MKARATVDIDVPILESPWAARIRPSKGRRIVPLPCRVTRKE
jgi:hypothetical protein